MNYAYRYGFSSELFSYIDIYKRSRSQSSTPSSHLLRDFEYRQAPCCVLVSNVPTPIELGERDTERVLVECTK